MIGEGPLSVYLSFHKNVIQTLHLTNNRITTEFEQNFKQDARLQGRATGFRGGGGVGKR